MNTCQNILIAHKDFSENNHSRHSIQIISKFACKQITNRLWLKIQKMSALVSTERRLCGNLHNMHSLICLQVLIVFHKFVSLFEKSDALCQHFSKHLSVDIFKNNSSGNSKKFTEAYSEPCQTSRAECFAKIVNS